METRIETYRGKARELLESKTISIGDTIRIVRNGRTYEGTLFPRATSEDDEHIVLKLKNGYNIGLRLSNETKVEFLEKGKKPTYEYAEQTVLESGRPRISIISTGGTIASRVDYRTGSVLPTLSAKDLLNYVPELAEIAAVETKILFGELSENLGPKHWALMASTAAEEMEQDKVGIVLSHGTDTMGYTAAALSFALQNLKAPVVIVGSQRSSDRPSSDAASNLIAATAVAVRAPIAEVVIVMHEGDSDEYAVIHRGTRARKCHTSSRGAFKSVNSEPIGRVNLETHEVAITDNTCQRRDASRELKLCTQFNDKVALVKFHPNLDPGIIEWFVTSGYRGIVLEGTGLGHVGKACYAPLKRAIESGMMVGMTSQCIWGAVNMNVYETGRDLLSLGVLPLEDMLPETAYVKMMWVLAQTNETELAESMMLENVAGELNPRRMRGI